MTFTLHLRPDPGEVRSAREFCVTQLRAAIAAKLADNSVGAVSSMRSDSSAGSGNGIPADADTYAGDELCDDAAMITSELVTNALRAGAGTIRLDIDHTADTFRIVVVDDAEGDPVLSRPDPLAVSGRGLHIISSLSSGWGVDDVPGGKMVWAELDLSALGRSRTIGISDVAAG